MEIFISNALAQTASEQTTAGLASFVPLILLFVVFYFILIRPQMKRQKEHAKMVTGLKVGDEAVTNGGLLGRIETVEESFVSLLVSEKVIVQVQKHSISQIMPKGTFKGK